MSKIGLIVSREFNQRVRKKSFILTTILTPLLLVGLMVAPALVMQLRSDQVKRIAVVDRSGNGFRTGRSERGTAEGR